MFLDDLSRRFADFSTRQRAQQLRGFSARVVYNGRAGYKKTRLERKVKAFAQPRFTAAHPSDALILAVPMPRALCLAERNSAAQTEAVTGRSALGLWRK